MALAYARSADTVRQRLKYTVVYMQVSMGKMQGMPYFSRFGYKKTTPKGGLIWSGRRGSNSLPPPWQGGALPDELRPQIILSVLYGFYIICIFPRFVKLKIRKISKASRASFFIHPSLWPKINGILFFFCFLGLSSLSSNSRENILINSPFEFNCLKVRKDSSKP